jgi:hypothetical protein
MSVELFYANGYPQPAYAPGAEAKMAEDEHWSPSSLDWEWTAKLSGGGTAVVSLDEIITQIGKKPVGSIDELGIIAHANSTYFSLSGTVLISGPTLPNVKFGKDGMVDAAGLTAKQSKIDAVKDRFAKGAQIVLYACHAGLDDSLLQAVAQSFGVCVYGFSNEIGILIQWNPRTNVVISRGKSFINDGSIAAGLTRLTDVARDNIHTLSPDKKSSKDCPAYRTKTSSSTTGGGSGGGSK